MLKFFTSPWVIGITGGIISGIIVFFVTNIIVSKKENRLYTQKISPTNFEILQTIRPLIVNKGRFNNDIFDSITSSLSNKHNVATKDLYSVSELCNDVITDIIQTPFLTSEQKDEYTENLLSIKKGTQPEHDKTKIIYVYRSQKSSISSKYLSYAMAMTTFLFAMFFTLTRESSSLVLLASNNLFKFSALGISLISLPVSALLIILLTEKARRLNMRTRLDESGRLKKRSEHLEEELNNLNETRNKSTAAGE